MVTTAARLSERFMSIFSRDGGSDRSQTDGYAPDSTYDVELLKRSLQLALLRQNEKWS